ncbi:hypothetical protein ACI2KG_21960 [Pseudomonas sp. NPDC089407]|uniref:hypothetical protein n=1 Tax=Pseudomonas sp. NPDC089407 TaxID=3364464 RepID=UPI00384F17B7
MKFRTHQVTKKATASIASHLLQQKPSEWGCFAAQSPASQLPQDFGSPVACDFPVGAGLPAMKPVKITQVSG